MLAEPEAGRKSPRKSADRKASSVTTAKKASSFSRFLQLRHVDAKRRRNTSLSQQRARDRGVATLRRKNESLGRG